MVVVLSPRENGDAGAPLVFVEVDREPEAPSSWSDDAVLTTNPAGKVVSAARDMVSDSVELARTCAARFSSGLQSLPDGVRAPEEVVLELGINLDAELGAVLAKARGGAQLKLTVTWRNEG